MWSSSTLYIYLLHQEIRITKGLMKDNKTFEIGNSIFYIMQKYSTDLLYLLVNKSIWAENTLRTKLKTRIYTNYQNTRYNMKSRYKIDHNY